MNFARRPKQPRGFTLIEMMISVTLMAVVLASGYMCLSAGVDSKNLIEARTEGVQSARVALALMAADLRMAVPMAGDTEFIGMRRTITGVDADNIDFSTRNYTPHGSREPDYCEISYYLEPDEESGSFILRRRRDPTPDPEPLIGGSREEIARGVKGLRIEYYDGFDWWDDWGDPEGKTKGMTRPPLNSYGLPEAVRITLLFDPESSIHKSGEPATEPKEGMTFQTVARLDLAPYFARQTSSSSSSSSGSTAQSPGAAPAGLPGGPQ